MKRGPEHPEASRKKLVGEHLRNADKLLKSGEYDQALAEVEQSLQLEPGNFYAQAYKERITALREKHAHGGAARPATAAGPPGAGLAAPQRDAARRDEGLTEVTGAGAEEIPPVGPRHETSDDDVAPPQRDLAELRDKIERERETHEHETQRQAEEIARRALEDELRQREETERSKLAEQRALAEALAAAPAAAAAEMAAGLTDTVERLLTGGDVEGAYAAFSTLRTVDPLHPRLREFEGRIEESTTAESGPAAPAKPIARDIPLQWYGKLLRSAWSEGRPNRGQADLLAEARRRFRVTDEEEKALLPGIQREIVTEAVQAASREGEPDPETRGFLETLARELSVPDAVPPKVRP